MRGVEIDFGEGLLGFDVLKPNYPLPSGDVYVYDVCGVPDQIRKFVTHADDLIDLRRDASQVDLLEYVHRKHSVKPRMR